MFQLLPMPLYLRAAWLEHMRRDSMPILLLHCMSESPMGAKSRCHSLPRNRTKVAMPNTTDLRRTRWPAFPILSSSLGQRPINVALHHRGFEVTWWISSLNIALKHPRVSDHIVPDALAFTLLCVPLDTYHRPLGRYSPWSLSAPHWSLHC